jgi:cytochrome c biogenesis protein
MMKALRRLASLKLTLAGLVMLLVNCAAVTQWPDRALPWLVVPLAILALNLAAAVGVRQQFRHQSALLLFHIGLLAMLLIAAAGVLLRFDGHVEVVEGSHFSADDVTVRSVGWLHRSGLDRISFAQETIEVGYLEGLRRDRTASSVVVRDKNAVTRLDIGDRHGFEVHGYRFMTTPNKGFALLLEWRDDSGVSLGSINFPSYPEFEWKQINTWETPAGEILSLELDLAERVPMHRPWQLTSHEAAYTLHITNTAGEEFTIAPGEALRVDGGRLRVAGLRLWMGYRIDYDPLLPWLLAAALLTLIAMAAHFVSKYAQAFGTPRDPLIAEEQSI